MKQLDAMRKFSEYDQKGRYVYALSDLRKIFHEDNKTALRAGINRLRKDSTLVCIATEFLYTHWCASRI